MYNCLLLLGQPTARQLPISNTQPTVLTLSLSLSLLHTHSQAASVNDPLRQTNRAEGSKDEQRSERKATTHPQNSDQKRKKSTTQPGRPGQIEVEEKEEDKESESEGERDNRDEAKQEQEDKRDKYTKGDVIESPSLNCCHCCSHCSHCPPHCHHSADAERHYGPRGWSLSSPLARRSLVGRCWPRH